MTESVTDSLMDAKFFKNLLWILHQVYEKVDWTVQNNEKVRKCWNYSECCTFVQLFPYFHSWNVQWYMPNENDTINAMFVLLQGVPQYCLHFVFLPFSWVLEHIQRNFWPFFDSPGNLLHDSHKNFENWFRNSLDNWHQSWHPSFWNWHFAIYAEWKK